VGTSYSADGKTWLDRRSPERKCSNHPMTAFFDPPTITSPPHVPQSRVLVRVLSFRQPFIIQTSFRGGQARAIPYSIKVPRPLTIYTSQQREVMTHKVIALVPSHPHLLIHNWRLPLPTPTEQVKEVVHRANTPEPNKQAQHDKHMNETTKLQKASGDASTSQTQPQPHLQPHLPAHLSVSSIKDFMTCDISSKMASSSSQIVSPTITLADSDKHISEELGTTISQNTTPATTPTDTPEANPETTETGSVTSASGRRRRVKKKKYRYACKFNESCDKIAKAGGMCIAHGGGKRCSLPGCAKVARYSGSLCHVHRTAEVDQLRNREAALHLNNSVASNLHHNLATNHAAFTASMNMNMTAAVHAQQQQQQQQQHHHHHQLQQQQHHLPASPLFRHQQHLQQELQQQLLRVNQQQLPNGGFVSPIDASHTPGGYNNYAMSHHGRGQGQGHPQSSSTDLLLAMYGLSNSGTSVGANSTSPIASSSSSPAPFAGMLGGGGGGMSSSPYFGAGVAGLHGANATGAPMSSMLPLSTMLSSSANSMLGSGGNGGGVNPWVTNSFFAPRHQPQQAQYYPQSNLGVGSSRRHSDVSQDVYAQSATSKRVCVDSPQRAGAPMMMNAMPSFGSNNPLSQSTMAQLHSIMNSVATTSSPSTSAGFNASSGQKPFMP
jgi:hypothetical protein